MRAPHSSVRGSLPRMGSQALPSMRRDARAGIRLQVPASRRRRPCARFDNGGAAKLKALERENRELRQANDILRKASAYFALAELDHRHKP